MRYRWRIFGTRGSEES